MLNFHYLAVFRAHKSCGVVTAAEVIAWSASLLLYIGFAMTAFCVHGNKGSETVTTVDVKSLCHRAQTMSGIEVTAIVFVVLHAPAKLVGIRAIRVFPVVVPE